LALREIKIIAVGQARLNSSRCNCKMLRPYGNTTLAELAVKRLAKLKNFDGVYFGAHENELLDIAKSNLPKKSIKFRTHDMANTDNMMLSYSWIKKIDFDYCMWINSCHGHLTPETLDVAIESFKKNKYKSMTSVVKRSTWYYNQNGDPVNNRNSKTQVISQDSEVLFEVAHAFHVFQKDHFFSTKTYWNNRKNDPFLYVLNDIEALDVDTEEDFLISESVYKSINNLGS
jgi:CMP-N-acetylneuraminic acid synthetase|tara:strand:+ start:118 stop:807 length:690 start_codon:yes stop_codon:yes gene_type:complete